jgi:hypothetical protein
MNAPATRPETSALSTGADPVPYAVRSSIDSTSMILDSTNFGQLMKAAEFMAKGRSSIPKHLQGNPTDCFSVLCVAARANLDPFGVARKTWQGPNGQLEYEGQLVIALINNSGMLQERLSWEWFGQWEKIVGRFRQVASKTKKDDAGEPKKYMVPAWDREKDEVGLGVIVRAHLKGEAHPRELTLLMAQAITRNSTLWTEDPRQQLAYLGSRRWGRLHTPEALMGISTPDERPDPNDITHMGDAEVVNVPPELLERAEEAASKGERFYQEFWKGATNLERAQLNELSDEHERLKNIAKEADRHRTVDVGSAKSKTTTAPPPPAAAGAPAATPAPTAAPADSDEVRPKTYAEVADMMVKATDPIAVEIAAEWIESFPDAQMRTDLEALRDRRLAELKGGK